MFFLPNETATLALGRAISKVLKPGLLIFLEGELGVGKTTLTRGILQGLGFFGRVKSPTYALVESYVVSNLCLHHFDLYRFNHPIEWEDAAFGEYLNAQTICLIEWADRAAELLPVPDWKMIFSLENSGRYCTLETRTPIGKACLKSLHYP